MLLGTGYAIRTGNAFRTGFGYAKKFCGLDWYTCFADVMFTFNVNSVPQKEMSIFRLQLHFVPARNLDFRCALNAFPWATIFARFLRYWYTPQRSLMKKIFFLSSYRIVHPDDAGNVERSSLVHGHNVLCHPRLHHPLHSFTLPRTDTLLRSPETVYEGVVCNIWRVLYRSRPRSISTSPQSIASGNYNFYPLNFDPWDFGPFNCGPPKIDIELLELCIRPL